MIRIRIRDRAEFQMDRRRCRVYKGRWYGPLYVGHWHTFPPLTNVIETHADLVAASRAY